MWKLPLPEERKHPSQSPRARIIVVWSATGRPPVRPGGGHLPSDRCPLCRCVVRGRAGYRKRRDTPHARGINRRLATLFFSVTKNRPSQRRCDAEWNRCVCTATSDSTCCSPGPFRTRRGPDPRARATKLGASRCPVRAHPVAVTSDARIDGVGSHRRKPRNIWKPRWVGGRPATEGREAVAH